MKRTRLLALFLAVSALMLSLAALASSASDDEDEYFTVLNDSVQPLDAAMMPVMSGGEIYAPYAIFSDRSLGVFYSYNSEMYRLTLYNRDYMITFDSLAQTAYDREQQYQMRLMTNGAGTICVPLTFVCEKFGLELQILRSHPLETVRVVSESDLSADSFLARYQPELVALYLAHIARPSAEPSSEPPVSAAPSAEPSEEASPPPEPKVVYITFDDGPNRNTASILDTLDEYGMKATFFLLGSEIEQERDTVRRMVGEGHSVGLHAWSHVGGEMYSSPEALRDELERAAEALDAVAQIRTRIFRFPYGSSYREVTPEMRDAVIGAGYRYWDWTVDALDYEQPSASALARTVIRGLDEADSTVVILMHDTSTTAEALPEILRHIAGGNFIVRTISVGDMPINFYGDVRTSPVD